jgi:hypothetical protein
MRTDKLLFNNMEGTMSDIMNMAKGIASEAEIKAFMRQAEDN